MVRNREYQSSGPLRLLIADSIREDIASGLYRPGWPIPSVRRLAEMHDCSRGSAQEAVTLLQGEGLLEVRRGRGTYVSGAPPVQDKTVFEVIGDLDHRITVLERQFARSEQSCESDEEPD